MDNKHKINEGCISCGVCASVCEYDAISEGKDRYVIDQDKCTNCDKCTDECPVGAIERPDAD